MDRALKQHRCSIGDENVSENLAHENTDSTDDWIGTHKTQNNANGCANYRKECEKSHPGSTAAHEFLGLGHAFLTDMQIALNPFHLSQMSNPIIEHAAAPVAYGSIDEQRQWLQADSNKPHHDSLTTEREKTSCYKGRYEHACITIADKKLDEGIHI